MTILAFKRFLMLISRGLRLVSRPYIFTVLNIYELYIPLSDIELVSSAYISTRLSGLTPGANEERKAI